MWKALDQQGAFAGTKVVTGLAEKATWSTFGDVAGKIQFLSHYVYTAPKNKVNDFLVKSMRKRNQTPDLFTPDGFVAAQMIVHALQKGDYDVDKMVSALEGWKFLGPKGYQAIRPQDHAMLQPMFQVQLVKNAKGKWAPKVLGTVSTYKTAPPVKSVRQVRVGSILSTQELRWDVGGATIVADVSLEVPEGECLGIIGPNGAGKTSLFNLLSGLIRPTAGASSCDGREITHDAPHRRTRAGLGRTFQVSSRVPAPVRVRERPAGGGGRRCGGTMRLWRRAPRLAQARQALERVGLADRAEVPAGSLSHGDKRKLELAMLLAADRRVILLDEPMAGVSAEEVEGLVELIRSVHREEGRTVLMVEHHMEVVTGLAERIAVMHHGALLACDTPAAVMADATVQEAYLGEPL